MWPNTQLTELLQIKYPIIQAPMAGGPTTPQLVAAVSNSDGLGSLGAAYLTPEQMRKDIQTIRSLTDQPFGVNLFIPGHEFSPSQVSQQLAQINPVLRPYREELGLNPFPESVPADPAFEEQIEVVLSEKVPFFSFTFGVLSEKWTQRLKAAGIKLAGTATTVREAIALEQAGVDVIVGQGSEAGGHRGTFQAPVERSLVGTLALIPQIVDQVKIPVIATGGIMDGRGIVAVLALGAVGAQLGTAFLTTPESGAHPGFKEAILNSTEEDTFITKAFSGRAARGLRNRFGEELQAYEGQLAAFPIQNGLTREIRQAASKQNRTEFLSMWAGQGIRLNQTKPTVELMADLVAQTEQVLKSIS